MAKKKKYIYGYRFIKDQGPEENWEYSLQAHKNQNGMHFDLRLAKPDNNYAYSWATKKMPLTPSTPILARRTHDHAIQHLDFEGPLITAKGKGVVKRMMRGKASIKKIDSEKGIEFKLDSGERFVLRNVKGKKYILMREE